jgi:hypothetical protein
MTNIAAIKDILSPGWRNDWADRWGIELTKTPRPPRWGQK